MQNFINAATIIKVTTQRKDSLLKSYAYQLYLTLYARSA